MRVSKVPPHLIWLADALIAAGVDEQALHTSAYKLTGYYSYQTHALRSRPEAVRLIRAEWSLWLKSLRAVAA